MAANPNHLGGRTPMGGPPGTTDPAHPDQYNDLTHFRHTEAASRRILIPTGDLTIPDAVGQNACQRQLYDSMTSFNSFILAPAYNPRGKKVLDICICPQRRIQAKLEAIVPKEYKRYTTPVELDRIAWEVVSDCLDYYSRQWNLLPADTPLPDEIDQYDNFMDRWNAMCGVLETNKIVLRSLIHDRGYRKRLIFGPNKENAAKGANERSNIQKALKSQAGNAALEQTGEEVEPNQATAIQRSAQQLFGAVQPNQAAPQQNQAVQPVIHVASQSTPDQNDGDKDEEMVDYDAYLSQPHLNEPQGQEPAQPGHVEDGGSREELTQEEMDSMMVLRNFSNLVQPPEDGALDPAMFDGL